MSSRRRRKSTCIHCRIRLAVIRGCCSWTRRPSSSRSSFVSWNSIKTFQAASSSSLCPNTKVNTSSFAVMQLLFIHTILTQILPLLVAATLGCALWRNNSLSIKLETSQVEMRARDYCVNCTTKAKRTQFVSSLPWSLSSLSFLRLRFFLVSVSQLLERMTQTGEFYVEFKLVFWSSES